MPWITGTAIVTGSALGALSGGGTSEEERLAKAQRKQQEQETATYRAAEQPATGVENYSKIDAMLQTQFAPQIADPLRIMNLLMMYGNMGMSSLSNLEQWSGALKGNKVASHWGKQLGGGGGGGNYPKWRQVLEQVRPKNMMANMLGQQGNYGR